MPKKSILIIAYSFAPIPYSGTYRILRLCRGLSNEGCQPYVLTIKVDESIPNDFKLLDKIPDSVKIVRTSIFDPWRKYQTWIKNKKFYGKKFVNKIVSNLFRLINLPDHQVFWIPFAVIKSLKTIKQNNIDTVLVSSPPNSSLIIGYILKKIRGISFIADLRDPIVGNVAQVHLISPKDPISRIEKKILEYIEKIIVNNADTVITNTETHSSEMKEKYGYDKFPFIRNSYDRNDYRGHDAEKFNKMTICHAGAMYGLRNADILFRAIKRLENEVQPENFNLEVLFVGNVDENVITSVNNTGVGSFVKYIGRVPHKDAIQIMLQSHYLLLVKAKGQGSLGQIPAKYYEYIGTGNKLMYIGHKESEVAGLIQEYDQGFIFDDNEDEVFRILKDEYNNFLNGRSVSIEKTNFEQFECEYMTKKFIEKIDSISVGTLE